MVGWLASSISLFSMFISFWLCSFVVEFYFWHHILNLAFHRLFLHHVATVSFYHMTCLKFRFQICLSRESTNQNQPNVIVASNFSQIWWQLLLITSFPVLKINKTFRWLCRNTVFDIFVPGLAKGCFISTESCVQNLAFELKKNRIFHFFFLRHLKVSREKLVVQWGQPFVNQGYII